MCVTLIHEIKTGVLTVAVDVDVAAAARSFRREKTEVTRVDTIFSNALERCSCFKQLCAVENGRQFETCIHNDSTCLLEWGMLQC